jgi:2-C-methyl-D-erythritol 4-phosphate cytidylyltransferase
MRFVVIIAAAGSGTRLGSDVPKAFITLGGKPLLAWSLETFRGIEGFIGDIVAVPAGFEAKARAMLAPLGSTVVRGGERRQDSVEGALAAVPPGIDLVAVHDAARPLVAADDIRATLEAALRTGAAILARPETDTLKVVDGDRIVGNADRSTLWRAETPQVFAPDILREAYRAWGGGLATDEAQIVTAAGKDVRVVGARDWNPKITYPADLEMVRTLAGARPDPLRGFPSGRVPPYP